MTAVAAPVLPARGTPGEGPDSEFARTARVLAARLVSLARVDGQHKPTWSGDDIDPRSAPDLSSPPMLVHGPLDDGLLTGRAGIAVALSAASRLPGAPAEWAPLAVRTAAASVRRSLSDLAAHVPSASAIGWDGGRLGTARAAAVVAGAHGAPGLAAASRHLAGLAVRRVADRPDELPPFADLMGGLAGVLAGVLSVPLDEQDEGVRADTVTLLVERIADLAVAGPIGHRWPMAGADHSVVGLAHGGSGIALVLTAAAQRRRRVRHRRDRVEPVDVCRRACLRGHALGGVPPRRRSRGLAGPPAGRAGAGSRLVPRSPRGRRVRRPAPPAPRRGWSGFPGCRGRARRVRPGTRQDVAHRPVGMQAFDGSVCHGLAGVVEMHLLAAATWPAAARDHLASARALATHLTRAGQVGHPTWLCGIRSGGRSPNLLVGGGIAAHPRAVSRPLGGPSAADPFLGALTLARGSRDARPRIR